MSIPSNELANNTTLQNNKYRINRVLGKGGFGITYLAHFLQKQVAIKEFFPQGSIRHQGQVHHPDMSVEQFEELKGKFKNEADTLTSFDNQRNIVSVHDVFYENNTVYFVMNYLQGQTLEELCAKTDNNCLTPRELFPYLQQIAQALTIVHQKNILHRDVKPENIIVQPDDTAVLIDFGSARAYAMQTTTHHSTILTPGYAPPEQYSQSWKRAPYTDVYALAASCYRLLCGKIPPNASERTIVDTLNPSQLNPAIPRMLGNVLLKGMELQPEKRYQNANDFVNDFRTAMYDKMGVAVQEKKVAVKEKSNYQYQQIVEEEKPSKWPLLLLLLIPLLGYLTWQFFADVSETTTEENYRSLFEEDGKTRNNADNGNSNNNSAPSNGNPSAEESIQNLINSMVAVKGGTFKMGCNEAVDVACAANEKPPHSVQLNDFHIGKYEITQAQWVAVIGKNPSKFTACSNCPVENVSWNDIQIFIDQLNQKTGQSFRLPTEAEWEYAARGGATSQNTKYAGGMQINKVAWNPINSNKQTQAIGKKTPNELGLYDMTGNVWEWCSDWYDADFYYDSPSENPSGPEEGETRVLRGGGWHFSSPKECRVTHRYYAEPTYRDNIAGFRLAGDF